MNLRELFYIASCAVIITACSDSSIVATDGHAKENQKTETIASPPPETVSLSTLLARDFSSEAQHRKKPVTPTYDEFEKAAVIKFGCVTISDYLLTNSACPEIRWKVGYPPQFYVRLGFFGSDWIFLQGSAFAIGEHSSTFNFQWESAFGQTVKDVVKGIVLAEYRVVNISEDTELISAFSGKHPAKVRLLGKAKYLDFPIDSSTRTEFAVLSSFFLENEEKLLVNN